MPGMRLGGWIKAVAERAVVSLEQLGKRYGDGPEILHNLSFALAPGSFHFVTGASGAGKTSLFKIISLAERPSSGTVTLFGIEAAEGSRAVRAQLRRRIGLVPQDSRFVEEIDVAGNVALPSQIDGAPEDKRRDHVAALLDWLGLADKAGVRPSALSAVERQRVALARALVRRPDLLLADEPLGEGGEDAALLLVDTFERMAQLGATVLVATRDTGFAERFAYPRLHLDAGVLSPPGMTS